MSVSTPSAQERYQREKEYHNKAFAEDLRHSVDKYYDTIQSSRLAHRQAMKPLVPGTFVLEYGCGPGSAAFDLAAQGARVVGIDLSEVAIEQSKAKALELGLEIDFRCMNAESLEFEDNTFDMIVGSAILHHLDLDKAYGELSRCLKPGGRAVFIEPTGHNPFLNLYRKMTPALRTVDERPMRRPDFDRAQRYFSNVQVRYYNMLTTAAVLFRRQAWFEPLLRGLDVMDRGLFWLVPGLKYWGWMAVMVLEKQQRSTGL
jgi:ubiquinone/menaquinone biosynthesis C-methylase UbiE